MPKGKPPQGPGDHPVTKKPDAELSAEMKAVLENLRADGKPINPASAAANIGKWLTVPELQPPVVPFEFGSEDDSPQL